MEHPQEEIQGVIEFQGFRGNKDEFIIKELVILDLTTNVPHYFLFKPPYNIKHCNEKSACCNRWLTKYFHSITWNEGIIDYSELEKIMILYCEKFKTIFTTGLEKANWISRYCKNTTVVPLQLSKEFKNVSILPLCFAVENEKHKHLNCALTKVYKLSLQMQSVW